MTRFWSSQTLGLPMKYFYLVLPVAFVLMSVRILANDYRVLIKGEALKDPEQAEIERLAHQHHEE